MPNDSIAPSDAPFVFVIPGQVIDPSSADLRSERGQVRSAVRLGARRGLGETVSAPARPGRDLIEIEIDNGPRLVLHPATAAALLQAQIAGKAARGAVADKATEPTASRRIEVPTSLGWPGLEQATPARGGVPGWLGKALVKTFKVVSLGEGDALPVLAASAATEALDGQVDAGLYALNREKLTALKGTPRVAAEQVPSGKPLLVMIHGTFVDTQSTFGKLWLNHRNKVEQLFDKFEDRVYALDHPTVGASPIANARTLVDALPRGARLHLLTHSRGGLVAEILARLAGDTKLDEAELAELFRDRPDAKPPQRYGAQLRELRELTALMQQRDIRVERIVRVACPARGTLLASRRLDAYLSVLRWLLEAGQVPVAPQFVQFLEDVALRRTSPEEMPGLEAMMPGSPLIQWLHAADEPIAGELRVVAGDCAGDSIGSWLKTLLSDAYFWTDNDLVVQTRSMYGGVPRRNGADFMLARGKDVSHFAYFRNEETAKGIVHSLLQAAPPQGFFRIGLLSWQGESAEGIRGRARARGGLDVPPNELPAAIVLPGILGTHLAVNGKRIWLSWRLVNGLDRLRWPEAQVEPQDPIGSSYDDLIAHLQDSHDVIAFGYDWRKPIREEAQRLADLVEAKLAERAGTGQPVRIVAHSMGGLVARALQLVRPDTWRRMMANEGARLLMLGTPNGGSWAPMQVLSGDDRIGNTLAAVGALFQDHKARTVMAGMPGFLQLQAGLGEPLLGLSQHTTWRRLAEEDLQRVSQFNAWHAADEQISAYRWGVPSQETLDEAVAFRRDLDAQLPALQTVADKLLLVVGQEDFTPAGFEMTEVGLEYLNAPQVGDGRVTLDSACLPDVRTWKVDASHGDLADKATAFDAYVELLDTGTTSHLPSLEGSTRSRRGGSRATAAQALEDGIGVQRSRPSRLEGGDGALPPMDMRNVLTNLPGVAPVTGREVGPSLQLGVTNGNLRFVQHPLLLGHYRSLALTGSERTMDVLLHGAMGEALRAGLYPDSTGAHQVFMNTWRGENPMQVPRPRAVVVVGLGEEGKLDANELRLAVRQATIAYAQRVSEEQAGGDVTFGLAATLIGSGGTGIGPGVSAQMIARGVAEANLKLQATGWPVVSRLELIEKYLDRAGEAWRALEILQSTESAGLALDVDIRIGTGALLRPPESGYRGAGYDFVTAIDPDASRPGSDAAQHGARIQYTLDTKRARSEVRGQSTQLKLIRELVRVAADDRNSDPQFSRTLFHLLVPVELEPLVASSPYLVLELDAHTAALPWELMDTQPEPCVGEAKPLGEPWAIRSHLIRKLRTEEFRRQPVSAGNEASVLVIGDPLGSDTRYPPLPGAQEEATRVGNALQANNVLLRSSALDIVNALFGTCYRIVHIAGHGELRDEDGGGVVMSNGTVLGWREIESMRAVPDLVFVNCCHIGAVAGDRPKFAASVARKLIEIGVRCVVAAGWAVDDKVALTFGTRFYESLLRGQRFIDAIGAARRAAWQLDKKGNTWAAYQCYGDPDWVYSRPTDNPEPRMNELGGAVPTAIISRQGLLATLQTLTVEYRFGERAYQSHLDQLRALQSRYQGRWGRHGDIAEAFGLAYAEASAFDDAIAWLKRAIAAEDGSASLRASEQLGNLMARQAFDRLDDVIDRVNLTASTAPIATLRKEVIAARTEVREAIALLERVEALETTLERASLVASAHKRAAMIEKLGSTIGAGNKAAWKNAMGAMVKAYTRAEELGRVQQAGDTYYPALNRMLGQLAMAEEPTPFDTVERDRIRSAIDQAHQRNPDFWSAAGSLELEAYDAASRQGLAGVLDRLLPQLDDLHARISSRLKWKSVYDQARFVLGCHRLPRVKEEAEDAASQKLLAALRSYARPDNH